MSKSILHNKSDGTCFICSRFLGDYTPRTNREEHHVFGGPNRKKSEHYGLKVYLCRAHHEGDIYGSKEAVHRPDQNDYAKRLHALAQQEFEKRYSHEDFMENFGRNYL